MVSSAIRRGEDGFWASHVEALTPDGFLLGAHQEDGVQKRPKDYDKGTWALELYIEIPATETQTQRFYDFLHSQIGKPYDMHAILAIAQGALTGMATLSVGTEQPSWICSALIVAGLLVAGVIKSAPSTVRLTDPRDVVQMAAVLTPIGSPSKPPPPVVVEAKIDFDPFKGA